MSITNSNKKLVIKSPVEKPIYNEFEVNSSDKKLITNSKLKLKKDPSNPNILNNLSFDNSPDFYDKSSVNIALDSVCHKCSSFREEVLKGLNFIKSYIDNVNDRINYNYLKVQPVRFSTTKLTTHANTNSNMILNGLDINIPCDYYHTIFYSEIDKLNISSEICNNFRNVMKSVKLFSDKYEYISKKHSSFEKALDDYKNIKLSNKFEENLKMDDNLNTHIVDDIKNLDVQSIFKQFNNAKENSDILFKELKSKYNSSKVNFDLTF